MWQGFQHILPQASRHFVLVVSWVARTRNLPPSPQGAESHFHRTRRCTHGALQWVACPMVWVGKQWMENADEKSRNQESRHQIRMTLDPCSNSTNWIGHKHFARVHVIFDGGFTKRENQSSCASLCQVQNYRFRSFQLPFIACKESRDLWSVTSQNTHCEWPCTLSHDGSAKSAVKNRSVMSIHDHFCQSEMLGMGMNIDIQTYVYISYIHSEFPVFKLNCFLLTTQIPALARRYLSHLNLLPHYCHTRVARYRAPTLQLPVHWETISCQGFVSSCNFVEPPGNISSARAMGLQNWTYIQGAWSSHSS